MRSRPCGWDGSRERFVVPVEPHVAVFLAHVAGPGGHFAMTQQVPGFVDASPQRDAFLFRDEVVKAGVCFEVNWDIDPVVIHLEQSLGCCPPNPDGPDGAACRHADVAQCQRPPCHPARVLILSDGRFLVKDNLVQHAEVRDADVSMGCAAAHLDKMLLSCHNNHNKLKNDSLLTHWNCSI